MRAVRAANVIAIVFDRSQQLGEVTEDWKKANVLPSSRRARRKMQ